MSITSSDPSQEPAVHYNMSINVNTNKPQWSQNNAGIRKRDQTDREAINEI